MASGLGCGFRRGGGDPRQRLQRRCGMTPVDGCGGQRGAVHQGLRAVRNHKGGGGVQQHDVARRAGLVPHPDYGREDTTVVYAKTDAPVPALSNPGLAQRLAAELKPMPPAAYLASGAWIWPMVRRNAKAVRDTFVSR